MAIEKEVRIAGGGLAGLCLGIALRQREIPVTLHEAGGYPRHRVCGEFVSGISDKALEELELHGIFQRAARQRNVAWWCGQREIFSGKLPDEAVGISRYDMDNQLRRRFEEMDGVVKTNSRLDSKSPEGTVWCAGRVPAQGPWLGLKCHLKNIVLRSDLEMHLGRNGYVGLARVEDGVVNVCGLFRQDRKLRGEDLLLSYLEAGGLTDLASRLRVATPVDGSSAAVAGFRLGVQAPKPGRLSLGDAWSMIPPFTGNGMSMAIESAVLAADPIAAYAGGRVSWSQTIAEVQGLLCRKFRARLFWARLMHPFLTRPGGQAFLSAVGRARLLPFNLCFHALR